MTNVWTEEASHIHPDEMSMRTVRYISGVFGHRVFELEEFLRDAPLDAPPAAWHIGLIRLCHAGTVRMMRKSWGERLYQMPVEVYYQKFADCWPEFSKLTGEGTHHDELCIVGEPHRSMTEQVLAAIIALDREPIELTREGKLSKRSLERVERSLVWSPELSQEARSRLLLETIDLILRTGLARKRDRVIMLDEPKVKGWLRLDAELREEQMFMLWYRVHCPDQPGLHWLTGAVFSQGDERWLPLAGLMAAARQLGLRLEKETAQDWLSRLHASGWLELGTDERGGRWVRRRERRQLQEKALIVQGDFEIIALPGTAFEVVRQLHRIGERLDWGGVGRYRLTRASIQAAAAGGWEAAEIIRFLTEHALDELPGHLAAAIHQWVEEQSGVRVYSGTVLEVCDPRAAALLDWHRSELPLRPLNERYWLAEGADEQSVMKLLKSIGIAAASGRARQAMPKRYDSTGERLPEESVLSIKEALSPRASGLFTPRDSSVMYREERPASWLEEVYPDHRKIPTSWYEQYRRYHHSTAKQLIEQAMRWRTGVRLQVAGEEYVVVPRLLEEREGVWMMEGSSGSMQVTVRVEEIEQLKLLMPGLVE
mgnify:CR=1 FL=1